MWNKKRFLIFKGPYYKFCRIYLKRLKTEYIDILLLHRPDALMEPEEVAETFNIYSRKGKTFWCKQS